MRDTDPRPGAPLGWRAVWAVSLNAPKCDSSSLQQFQQSNLPTLTSPPPRPYSNLHRASAGSNPCRLVEFFELSAFFVVKFTL
jgi:hypothetical protein